MQLLTLLRFLMFRLLALHNQLPLGTLHHLHHQLNRQSQLQ
jgi:hypothetical protein